MYQGEGFLVITGEVGPARPHWCAPCSRNSTPKAIVAAQIVSTQLEADDLLRSVAKAFGIRVPQEDKASLLASIEAFLLMLFQQNKRALLVVDEAQNLNAGSIEELRMLSNFQCGDQALLQSFLVGQPELRNLMRSPAMEQFRQRVIASYHLGPLDEDETRGYIEHRLHRVAWKGNPEFDPSAIHAIYHGQRRHSTPHQLDLQPADAGGFPGGPAALHCGRSRMPWPPRSAVRSGRRRSPRRCVSRSRRPADRHPDLVGNVRRLLSMADRVDRLEKDVNEVLKLVRMLVEPERAHSRRRADAAGSRRSDGASRRRLHEHETPELPTVAAQRTPKWPCIGGTRCRRRSTLVPHRRSRLHRQRADGRRRRLFPGFGPRAAHRAAPLGPRWNAGSSATSSGCCAVRRRAARARPSSRWAGSRSAIRGSCAKSSQQGHELASHGQSHLRASEQSRADFQL